MTPKCCENCENLTKDKNCSSKFRDCKKWRAWFHNEWTDIKKAAAQQKKEDPPE